MDLRSKIVGIEKLVPLLNGEHVRYVNLDNAASTPMLVPVQEKMNEALAWYSSVHRGSGFKSMLSTELYEEARDILLDFVGADPSLDVVAFTKNTTEALNRLARVFPFEPGDMVLTTGMEHHSNDLPWRAAAETLHANIKADGSLDLADLKANLEQYSGRIKLVAVTGASNVSGYINPIHDIAEWAHEHGALMLADCAQLMPHRPVDMLPHSDPRHLDFVVLSAHKIYAPLGSGALVGPREFFNRCLPDDVGGGTVEIVTLEETTWTGAPERNEAGSPNVIGAVALAASLKFLKSVGMDEIARHEAELTRYALTKLQEIPEVTVYGSKDPEKVTERVGVIPFSLQGYEHGEVASILGFEGGIGVRNGCFCAHPYILRLLGVSDETYRYFYSRVLEHNRADLPGLLRMSFGCYSNEEDVDRLVAMLKKIVRGDVLGEYAVDHRTGNYYPAGFDQHSVRGKYFTF